MKLIVATISQGNDRGLQRSLLEQWVALESLHERIPALWHEKFYKRFVGGVEVTKRPALKDLVCCSRWRGRICSRLGRPLRPCSLLGADHASLSESDKAAAARKPAPGPGPITGSRHRNIQWHDIGSKIDTISGLRRYWYITKLYLYLRVPDIGYIPDIGYAPISGIPNISIRDIGYAPMSVYCDIMPILVHTRYRVYPISGAHRYQVS